MAIQARLIRLGAPAVIVAAGALAYQFEGEHRKTYLDPIGIPTVCIGETGKVVVLGKTYTEQECAAMYLVSLITAHTAVLSCTPTVPEAMQPALVSFAFNAGGGAYCSSTLAKRVREGRYREACEQLPRWVYADGKKLPGLVKRRAAEAQSCIEGVIP